LEQDASIYDYDGVYDEMKNEKNETAETKKAKDKKPKYMEALLKTAEKRQQLHERRTERKVQKEREAEGDEFADKGWSNQTERILYFKGVKDHIKTLFKTQGIDLNNNFHEMRILSV